MRNKIVVAFILCVLMLSSVVLAAEQGYEFKLTYEGDVIAGKEKSAIVTLTGTEAVAYTNVQVKSEHVSGPAKATVYAYDESGKKFDLSESGSWGPTSGFAVGGTFTNDTKISIIYPEEGTYVSRLSLIDLSNNNAVITSKEFTVTVKADETQTPANNVVVNNTIDEIPKAGMSLWVYIVVIGAVVVISWLGINFMKNKKD